MRVIRNCNKPAGDTINSSTDNVAVETAIKNIKSAIDSLSQVAKENTVAKEAIANLSVVLLDLKN